MANTYLRFGIWAAAHVSSGPVQEAENLDDASWSRNRSLVLEADALRSDAVLIAQQTVNSYTNALDQSSTWSAAAALAALTKADLGDQQKIADTFLEAHLIPRAIDATAVKLWQPGAPG